MSDGRWREDAETSLLPEGMKARIVAMFTEREDVLKHVVKQVLEANDHTRTIDELIASRAVWRRNPQRKQTREKVQQYCRRVAKRIRTKADDIHVFYDGKTITITA
jgi:hypothetical protein